MENRVWVSEEELRELFKKGRQNVEDIADIIAVLEADRSFMQRDDISLLNRYIKEVISRFSPEEYKDRLLIAFGVHPDYPESGFPARKYMRVQHALDHGLCKHNIPLAEMDEKQLDSEDRRLRNKEMPMANNLADIVVAHIKENDNQPLGILAELTEIVKKEPEITTEPEAPTSAETAPTEERASEQSRNSLIKSLQGFIDQNRKLLMGIMTGGLALIIIMIIVIKAFPAEPIVSPAAVPASYVNPTEFMERIGSDPAFAYMVSLGIVETIEGSAFEGSWADNADYSKIREFVSVSGAVSTGEHGIDLSRWYPESANPEADFPLEYKTYSGALNNLLFFSGATIQKKQGESRRNWKIVKDDSHDDVVIAENDIQVKSPWVVITFDFPELEQYVSFGIGLEDTRFGYLDSASLEAYYPPIEEITGELAE